jgi:cell division protein ZapE
VATSNSEPENLYFDGLQRSRFLPAIEAIKRHTNKVHLAGLYDHRERPLEQKQIYFLESLESETQPKGIALLFEKHELPTILNVANNITVLGREIPCLSRNDTSICFEFSELCEGPRSHLDYIQLARQFQTVILLNIPSLSGSAYEHIKARGTEDGCIGSGQTGERKVVHSVKDDAVRRFIALIDEFYERKVKLYLSGNIPLSHLYTEGSLSFEFERARSRLTEVASVDYHQLPHLP